MERAAYIVVLGSPIAASLFNPHSVIDIQFNYKSAMSLEIYIFRWLNLKVEKVHFKSRKLSSSRLVICYKNCRRRIGLYVLTARRNFWAVH